MNEFLSSKIEYLKGVGPQRGELLRKELGIHSFGDLAFYFPIKHIDKTKFFTVSQALSESGFVQIVGTIGIPTTIGDKRFKRLTTSFYDHTGEIELVWFKGHQWILNNLKPGNKYVVYGKINDFKGRLSMPHPEMEELKEGFTLSQKALQPIYSLTEAMRKRNFESKQIAVIMQTMMEAQAFRIPEFLPISVIKNFNLVSRETAVRQIHFPDSWHHFFEAQRRLKFEEMFVFQMRSEKIRLNRFKNNKGVAFEKVGDNFKIFYEKFLPFELTEAQKRVIKEIRNDLGSGRQMNRLLQGDVGSGKTIVALMCMLLAADNNCQSCLMAPTEILATQHYESLKEFLSEMDVEIALLTGSTPVKERKAILEKLENGTLLFLIGTHALLEDPVLFKKLGLVIIDEQHRFGVAQRARLWKKANPMPHILVMTATPIPRTLAMTIHGELDTSVIDKLPEGRKPIRTVHRYDKFRGQVMEFVRNEIHKGRQAYIVFPLIEESETLDLKNLMEGYDMVCDFFPVPQYQISILHGRLKPSEKEHEMKRFKEGITNIMIATTVIEVGVNVPNASVMIIENAERFGLSQLHQLRGRVGRGAEQSFCILMTKDKLNPVAKERIDAMVSSTDGFEIAKTDLKLRGPGDLMGTRQSGLPEFKVLDLVKDEDIIAETKKAARMVLEQDAELFSIDNQSLYRYLLQHQKDNFWSRVS